MVRRTDVSLRHLKPGYGWFEQVEIDLVPRCDDRSLQEPSELHNWSRFLLEATQRSNRPLAYNPETGDLLANAGYVDIRHEVIRLPINPWPEDQHEKEVGRWYCLGLTQHLVAYTMGPLTRMSNWDKERVTKLVDSVRRMITARKNHVYHEM